ncbi:Hypothetical predicted protein [Cloeon dipterum]|uniref:Uncharacterized protein n=1 Tax=Cloeon dipterum TaxID=197152 RepID=A0A8S1BZU0_9INSE|nr:Hypothetical predicted protein [Cloeon dipterum]
MHTPKTEQRRRQRTARRISRVRLYRALSDDCFLMRLWFLAARIRKRKLKPLKDGAARAVCTTQYAV